MVGFTSIPTPFSLKILYHFYIVAAISETTLSKKVGLFDALFFEIPILRSNPKGI